jgi:hypothetical protein
VSIDPMMLNGGPPQGPQTGGADQADPDAVTNALLWAVQRCAEKASTAADTREAAEALKAALAGAQAIIVLDPGLNQQGVPLDHELALEQTRQDGMLALEQARAAAAAPSPAKQGGVEAPSA